ncbi:MAG: HDIG domain-containing protein [Bacteroidales bacterium]
MERILELFKKYYNGIVVISLFVITALLILYLLPREGKFRYEYQRGRPWMHETLIAPFNFPIYKSESELEAERDSVLEDFRPYFQYDSLVYDSIIKAYNSYFQRSWEGYFNNQSESGVDMPEFPVSENPDFMNIKDAFIDFSSGLLREVYEQGILDPVEAADRGFSLEESIIIVKNNIGERTSPEEFFTQKSAYEHITGKIDEWLSAELSDKPSYMAEFFNTLEYSDFVMPNLFFDEATTNRVRQSLLEDISHARGMVQAGERIVSKGDLITGDIFLILESLRREYETKLRGANLNMILLGQFILVFSLVIILYLFLYNFRREILHNIRKTLFILFLLFMMVFMSIMFIRFSMISFYIVPFAIVPIIMRTFYDERLALFIHTIILLLVGFFAPNSFEFVFLNFVIGIVAIFSLTNLHRRSKLFFTAVIIILSYSLLYFGIAIIQERSIEAIEWINFVWFGGNGLLVLTTYPLLYIFEKTFGFISDATLMELSDTNQPLLRKLAEEAPGTFQHSIQVANLSEAAVNEIGGNPLLVRTGALYHDIGKMSNPFYFIENQTSGYNPHNSLEFEESAQMIISHVTKGVEMAKKNNLPVQIIDFILTHHGTTRVQYFYKSYLNKYPDDEVDAGKYTYPGPRPFSKETAALMMADSVEAASRSLKEINMESINALVDSIIDNQVSEEQFANTEITFRDISKIKEVYKKKLRNIYHARVAYPE